LIAVLLERLQSHPVLSLDQCVRPGPRDESQSSDGGDDGDLVEVAKTDVVWLGVALHREDDAPVGVDSGLEPGHGAPSPGRKRRQLVREDDIVPQRHHREPLGYRVRTRAGHDLVVDHAASITPGLRYNLRSRWIRHLPVALEGVAEVVGGGGMIDAQAAFDRGAESRRAPIR
jgi:hypothetical protein